MAMDCLLNNCRICLNSSPEMTTIESLLISADILELFEFFEIKVTEDDPSELCTICVGEIKNILTFKNRCALTNEILNKRKNNLIEEIQLCEANGNQENSDNEIDSCGRNSFELKSEHDSDDNVQCKKDISKNYSCSICSKLFKNDSTLTKHKTTVHNIEFDTVFCCQSCSKIFSNELDLNTHQEKSHETVCNICNKKFYSNTNLRKHQQLHQTNRPKFFCDKCKKLYGTKEIFDRHNKIYHSQTPQTKTICSVCGSAVYHIKIHMHNTHSDIVYVCSYCDKALKNQVSLKKHIARVHKSDTLKSNSLCSECGKVCRTKDDLIIHIKSKHSDERNYQCQHCDKRFKTNSHWRVHEKIVHMKQRPFNCEHCSKTFTTRRHLSNHIRTHTGEKPYVCNICSRAFSQKGTLDTHTKLVHRLAKFIEQTH